MPSGYVRKVIFEPAFPEKMGFDYYANYINFQTGWLIPNTRLYDGERLVIEINSLGCKGDEPRPDYPAIGYFGDSTTFGVNVDSWPNRVAVRGAQNVNGAVEGHTMDRVVEQYDRQRDNVDFVAGVFFTGWHNILYHETGEAYWRSELERISGLDVVAVCTLATPLMEACLERGIEPLLSSEPGREFGFWGDLEPSLKNIEATYHGVRRFNAFIRDFSEEKGWVLIDFEVLLRPNSYEEIPERFFDVLHMRHQCYPMMAVFATEALQEPVAAALARRRGAGGAPPSRPGRGPEKDEKPKKDAHKDDIYPLW